MGASRVEVAYRGVSDALAVLRAGGVEVVIESVAATRNGMPIIGCAIDGTGVRVRRLFRGHEVERVVEPSVSDRVDAPGMDAATRVCVTAAWARLEDAVDAVCGVSADPEDVEVRRLNE